MESNVTLGEPLLLSQNGYPELRQKRHSGVTNKRDEALDVRSQHQLGRCQCPRGLASLAVQAGLSLSLSLFAASLTSYRWMTIGLPSMLLLLVACVSPCIPLHCCGRQHAPLESLLRRGCASLFTFGFVSIGVLVCMDGVSLILLGASLASLPATVTLVFPLAVPTLASVWSGARLLSPAPTGSKWCLTTRGGCHGPHVCVVAAAVVALLPLLTGRSMPMIDLGYDSSFDTWTVEATAASGIIAALASLVGLVLRACSSRYRRMVVSGALATAIDDEYYSHEREREAKEAAKLAAKEGQAGNSVSKPVAAGKAAVTNKKTKQTSSLSLKKGPSTSLSVDVGALDFCVSSLTGACTLVLAVALADAFQTGFDPQLTHVASLHPAGTNHTNSTPVTRDLAWQLHHGSVCAFRGGDSDVDGANLFSFATAPATGYTPFNACPLVLPSAALALLAFACMRGFEAATAASVSTVAFADAYAASGETDAGHAAAPASTSTGNPTSSSSKVHTRAAAVPLAPVSTITAAIHGAPAWSTREWLSHVFAQPACGAALLYLPIALISAVNPLAQQASPLLWNGVSVTDPVACGLLLGAALWDVTLLGAAGGSGSALPPTYPSRPAIAAPALAFTVLVGGVVVATQSNEDASGGGDTYVTGGP